MIIGGAGYLGSVLSELLLSRGFQVRVFDDLTYGDSGISDFYANPNFELMEGSVSEINNLIKSIEGVGSVIDLAAIVGDPASSIDPKKTIKINYHSTRTIANICKDYGVNRLIFASTCSVYGVSTKPGEFLREDDDLNPVSLYAQTKIDSESVLLEMSDKDFKPIIFRMGTLFGLSKRMRFDLAVNIMSAKAFFEDKVTVFDGDQYRPFLHLKDAALAYLKAITHPIDEIKGGAYNIGSNNLNYKLKEVGNIISEIADCDIDIRSEEKDPRSYCVNFDKFQNDFSFECSSSIEDSVRELIGIFNSGKYQDFYSKKYSNFKYLSEVWDVK